MHGEELDQEEFNTAVPQLCVERFTKIRVRNYRLHIGQRDDSTESSLLKFARIRHENSLPRDASHGLIDSSLFNGRCTGAKARIAPGCSEKELICCELGQHFFCDMPDNRKRIFAQHAS